MHLPLRRLDWTAPGASNADERALLSRFVAAIEQADDAALAELLRDDARVGHQPGAGGQAATEPAQYTGRATIIAAWAPALHGPDALEFQLAPIGADGQPGTAAYVRTPGDSVFRGFALNVIRIEGGRIAEVLTFHPDLFPRFGLPRTLGRS